MNPRALILILLAGVGFILVFFLTRAFLANNTQQAQPTQQVAETNNDEIMVAVQNLPVGTIVTVEHIKPQKWPAAGITEEYYAKREDSDPVKNIVGKVVRYSIQAGTPITRNSLVAHGERGFMAAILNPGMRAVTVDINRSSGIAGFIYPGDRVDVIMTHRVRIEELENSSRRARTRRQNYNLSETILSNVRVLGVDQISEKDKAGAKVRRTATLEVTPKIAEKLSVMRRVGQLSLSLRSLAREDGTAPTDSTTPPIGDTISTTQAGELSSFLPKIGDKPPRKEIVVDRGNRREVINLAKNPDDENEVNSLTIDRPRNDDGIESRNDDGIE